MILNTIYSLYTQAIKTYSIMLKSISLKFLIIFIIFFSVCLHSQNSLEIELFPFSRTLQSFRGNMKEGRVGVLYFVKDAHLKVDIGNSIDVAKLKYENSIVTLGIDFSAFAYSTNNENLRLQIDALDGLFGGNISYIYCKDDKIRGINNNSLIKDKYFARFRFMHNSAHLVDGNWWMHSYPRDWLKEGGPIPFTRDFAELFVGLIRTDSYFYYKAFTGIEYATHFRPEAQKKVIGNFGTEVFLPIHALKLYNKTINAFCSYFGVLNGFESYVLNNHVQAGLKIGNPEEKGLVIYFSYYSGNNYFSEYYTDKIERVGLGFEVDF